MRKYCFLFLMSLAFNSTWAQNSFLDYQMAIKAYNQSTYEVQTEQNRVSDTTTTFETNSSFQIIQPVIAFQWKTRRNNFHEVGISRIGLTKNGTKKELIDDKTGSGESAGGMDILEASLAVRYEYILNFNKKADNRMVPSLGFGAGTYYFSNSREPYLANSYPVSEIEFGLQLFLTPRLSYYFSPKWFLDINFPICISDFKTTVFKVKNPAFTKTQQSVSEHTSTAFPKIISGRIGIGFKL